MKKVLVTGGSGFIGVHLIDHLIESGYEVANIDIRPPINFRNQEKWTKISILDKANLKAFVENFQPNYIVHLAAVTTQDAMQIGEFEVNIKGTENLLEIAEQTPSILNFIFTSSQYVNTPGCDHEVESTYIPYGLYGESKLIGEHLVRKIFVSTPWTIIRPGAIWGPWHEILTDGLWTQIYRNRYFHPLRDDAIKGYGYVKNAAWQIGQILSSPKVYTDRKIYYIGDENFKQVNWVNEFHKNLINKEIRRIPNFLIFLLSELGKYFGNLEYRFRFFEVGIENLITSNPVPVSKTIDAFGIPPFQFEESVKDTCRWFISYSNSKAEASNLYKGNGIV